MDERLGMDELRLIVQNMNDTRDRFNENYSLEELIQIYRMHLLSEWDFYPDEWTSRQVKEALKGIPPQWNKKTEKPLYGKKQVL